MGWLGVVMVQWLGCGTDDCEVVVQPPVPAPLGIPGSITAVPKACSYHIMLLLCGKKNNPNSWDPHISVGAACWGRCRGD